ncbi:hypothetical protein EUTSA_v10011157mg, partial [Eutrema salsugineum]
LKTFLWRAARGALPVGTNLASRILGTDPSCHRCGQPESTDHLLFHCDFARTVWHTAPFSPPISIHQDQQFHYLWKDVKDTSCSPPLDLPKGLLAPWICWNLWKARNNSIFSDKSFSEVETLNKSIADASKWYKGQTSKPKRAGLGWTFSPLSGPGPRLFSRVSGCIPSPLIAEGMAMRSALSVAAAEDIRNLSVFSDSLTLIKAINSGTTVSEIHGILEDISCLSELFDSISFNFVPRRLNVTVDALAKNALYSSELPI